MYGELSNLFRLTDPDAAYIWTNGTPQNIAWENQGDFSNATTNGIGISPSLGNTFLAHVALSVFVEQPIQLLVQFALGGEPISGGGVVQTISGHGSIRIHRVINSTGSISVQVSPLSAVYPLTVYFYQGIFTVHDVASSG
jgi:hypothetical protein